MKRFSLKLKLTAMYSFFMVLVTCLCLAVLFSLSGNEILTSAQMHLRERVQESADEIELVIRGINSITAPILIPKPRI